VTCKQSRDTTVVSLMRLSSGKIFLQVYRHPSLNRMSRLPGCRSGLCYWQSPTTQLHFQIKTNRMGITIAFVMGTFHFSGKPFCHPLDGEKKKKS